MAGFCRIVADGVRRAVVGRVGDASLVRGIGWAGDAMRGCGRGRRRCVRRRREMRSRCRNVVVVVVMVGVKSWRPSWIHSAEVLAASSKSATRACGAIQRRSSKSQSPETVRAEPCLCKGMRGEKHKRGGDDCAESLEAGLVVPPSSCRRSPVDMHPAATVVGRRQTEGFFPVARPELKQCEKKLLPASRLKAMRNVMDGMVRKKKVAGQPLTARDRQALETFSSAPSSPFVSPEQPQFSFKK